MMVMDPVYYFDRMEHIPKYLIFSSDDEFMMSDWPSSYWDKIPGEKHLFVCPNTEHTLASGFYNVLGGIGAFIRSVNNNNQISAGRPEFEYHLDNSDGEITIKIPRNKV
jgi:PhoPQ-activated pathogenicity-related protein